MLIMNNTIERMDFKKDCKSIGDVVANERKKMGLSQEDFAEKFSIKYQKLFKSEVNVCRQTISKWEWGEGKSYPDVKQLYTLCDWFNCDVLYLLKKRIEKTETIHDICERTHLSEKAVTNILEYKDTSKYGDTIKVINFLLESNDFLKMIQNIIIYKNCLPEILDTPDENYKLFDIRREFELLVDDITDIHTAKKQKDDALKKAPRPKKLF